jgi:S1-C subfamily serine protease
MFDFEAVCSPRVRSLKIKKLCELPAISLRDSIAPIIFDVPHGKLWFSKDEAVSPVFENSSGVGLKFGYLNHDRALIVSRLDPHLSAHQLFRAGLRIGDPILEVDGIPSSKLDLWEVNRHLAGVYGKQVSIKWSRRGNVETLPISVGEMNR